MIDYKKNPKRFLTTKDAAGEVVEVVDVKTGV